MRQLSGIDSGVLYGVTPTWPMHVGGVMILEYPDESRYAPAASGSGTWCPTNSASKPGARACVVIDLISFVVAVLI